MGEVRSLLAPPPLRPTGLPTVLLHLLLLPLLLQLLPLLSRLPTTGLPRPRPPTGLHSLHLLARLLLLPRPGVDPVSGARLHFQHLVSPNKRMRRRTSVLKSFRSFEINFRQRKKK